MLNCFTFGNTNMTKINVGVLNLLSNTLGSFLGRQNISFFLLEIRFQTIDLGGEVRGTLWPICGSINRFTAMCASPSAAAFSGANVSKTAARRPQTHSVLCLSGPRYCSSTAYLFALSPACGQQQEKHGRGKRAPVCCRREWGSNTSDVHLSVKLSIESRACPPPPPRLSLSLSPSVPCTVPLTRTLCRPVRLGDSQSSWVSDTVSMQGFSPIRTV